uniref:DNA topoisomerase n=1 Tax=Ditylenchus dipsaci TaxID=166011 RepID=A0A915D2I2_9BILA
MAPEHLSTEPTARRTFSVDGKPLSKLLVADLRVALQNRNLPTDGKKDQLVERLKQYLLEHESKPSTSAVSLNDVDMLTVLMVAEKPLMASQIARIVAKGAHIKYRKAFNEACAVSEFGGEFMGKPAVFKVTSTCGHIMKTEFPDEFQRNRNQHEPIQLYDCPVRKIECNPKLKMNKYLAEEANGCDFLVLWLDCDLEGENICFEVMNAVQKTMEKNKRVAGSFIDKVYRARFSSLKDIETAMDHLIKPNLKQSQSVDAKKELDLRIGVASSRFLTSYLRKRNRDRDIKLVSYGPCQTPTLAFCVEEDEKVKMFQVDQYYSLSCEVQVPGLAKKIKLEYAEGPVRSEQSAQETIKQLNQSEAVAKVVEIQTKMHEKVQPRALNTVELLKAASSKLGFSPADAMKAAENLYSRGYISYPRTETTVYPKDSTCKNIDGAVQQLEVIEEPRKGEDKGDHPPIYPVKSINRTDQRINPREFELYDYICKHFVASLMKKYTYETSTVMFAIGAEKFQTQVRRAIEPGFTKIMPWQAVTVDEDLVGKQTSPIQLNKEYSVSSLKMTKKKTATPTHLTEAELIAKMENYGIGTDASIPTHVQNICDRNYVKVEDGRRLVPTPLGIALVKAYKELDQDLVLPTMRAEVEKKLSRIARGEADLSSVRDEILHTYRQKFELFCQRFNRVEHLFQGCFPMRELANERIDHFGENVTKPAHKPVSTTKSSTKRKHPGSGVNAAPKQTKKLKNTAAK